MKNILMKKAVSILLVSLFMYGPAATTQATNQGEYQVYGILLSITSGLLGIGSILSFSEAGKDTEDAETEKDFYHGLFMGLGAVASGGMAAYCFNHSSKRYGAFITVEDNTIALRVPDIQLTTHRDGVSTECVEVRF